MNGGDLSFLRAFVLVIDIATAGVIFGHCVVAFVTAARSRSSADARIIVAKGALLGLSMKTVAALLKAIELQTWNQILLFVLIFGLKVILKRVFMLENKTA